MSTVDNETAERMAKQAQALSQVILIAIIKAASKDTTHEVVSVAIATALGAYLNKAVHPVNREEVVDEMVNLVRLIANGAH